MKKSVIILTFIFIVCLVGNALAEINISGDMRLRPRLDLRETVTDDGSVKTTTKLTDGYYYYRARLNLKTDLGEGYFGHVQLGTNGLAYWSGKFGDGDKPSGSSISTSGRGNVDFMLLYFGRKTKQFGYMGGIIPVNGLSNPILDLHYYSDKMIDVPFFLFSNNGSHGFTGYIGFENGSKVNASIFVDENETQTEVEIDSTGAGGGVVNTDNELKDTYTIMLDAPLKLSDFTLQPVVFFTAIAADGMAKPVTYGANITTPKVGKFTFYGSFGASSQSEDMTDQYSSWYARLKTVGKLGKGTFTGWVDIAEKKYDEVVSSNLGEDFKKKFFYFWLAYEIPVYKSDVGSFSIKPTWRHISEKREDSGGFEYYDFTREKIELTIDFKFK